VAIYNASTSKADEIHTRRDAVIGRARSIAADDARDVRAVRAINAVIVGVGIILGEIPAADDAVARTEAAAEGDVVPRDAAVDDRDGLADKGKRGTVTQRVDADHLLVDGINMVKKHVKPNPMKGSTGGVIDKAMPIHQSNVAIYNASTSKADRVGIKLLDNGDKIRIYKSSGEPIKA
jgi:large subunit ribosomal protein L24